MNVKNFKPKETCSKFENIYLTYGERKKFARNSFEDYTAARRTGAAPSRASARGEKGECERRERETERGEAAYPTYAALNDREREVQSAAVNYPFGRRRV